MIRVVADSSSDAALIADAVGGAAELLNGVGPFRRGDSRVECVVLACRPPVPPARLTLAREIEREVPWVPIIFVTDPAPGVARWLAESGVSDIVWFENIQTELRPRIETLCRTAVLFGLAEEVDGSALSPALRSALSYSIRAAADRPVRSVKTLAEALGRAPVTLSQAFRKSVAGDATLSQFLSALVILRAHQLRTSGLSWEVVGERLRFTRPTLHRKSKQWPGRTLKELARTPRQHLLAAFVADHMQPLLNGNAPAWRNAARRPASTTEPTFTDARSSMS